MTPSGIPPLNRCHRTVPLRDDPANKHAPPCRCARLYRIMHKNGMWARKLLSEFAVSLIEVVFAVLTIWHIIRILHPALTLAG